MKLGTAKFGALLLAAYGVAACASPSNNSSLYPGGNTNTFGTAGTGAAAAPAGTGGMAGMAGTPATGGVPDSGGTLGTGGTQGEEDAGGAIDSGIIDAGSVDSGGTAGDADSGTTKPPTPDTCPPPPDGASDKAIEAWTLVNKYRLAAGAGCMNLVTELIASAQAHCDYLAANKGNPSCDVGTHSEATGCTGFTGTDVQSREIAAGYPRALAYTEVATSYGNNPTLAVPSWIDTVWHRIPLLDPWTVDMGWGGGPGCDVIDIGRGTSSMPANTIVVYPYDGQTDVPPAFSGSEGPAPPPPPSGWPSAYPINIYAQRISVTEHVVMKDGDNTPLEHLWLDYNSPQVSSGLKGYFTDTAFLYGAPFELTTKYRVRIVGTYAGGSFTKEWTFTTGSQRPWGT